MQQLKDQNSKSPHISFHGIEPIDESLRRHVDRRSDAEIFEGGSEIKIKLLSLNCESKVSKLGSAFFEEDVGSFDIPVNYVLGVQIVERLVGVPDVRPSLILGHLSSLR